MERLAHAHAYFDGWNAHDAEAIAATFAPGGTYTDPIVQSLGPEATGAYAVGLAAAFPDLRFELVTASLTDDGAVAAQWVMRGTNSGSFNGLPPTGREIALPGADFITFTDGGIETVTGYFDGGRVPRDLGLDVIVQPSTIGPWTFGVASRATAGRDAPAGALSVTFLEARTDEEVEEVRRRSREIVHELLGGTRFPLVRRRDRRTAHVHHQRLGDSRGSARRPQQPAPSRGRLSDVRAEDRLRRANGDMGAVAPQRAHGAMHGLRQDVPSRRRSAHAARRCPPRRRSERRREQVRLRPAARGADSQ